MANLLTRSTSFITDYTYELQKQILDSDFASIDFETTGLTATSIPIAMRKATPIGHMTYGKYKMLFPECTINCALRARIFSVGLDNGEVLVFDLDKMEINNKISLIIDSINDKVIIGHNLVFDLGWAVEIAGHDLHPKLVIDTMLLARVLRPGITFKIHEEAAKGDEDCLDILQNIDHNNPVSLASLAAAHGLGSMDKAYQKPANWCLSVLSNEHFDYVKSDVLVPVQIYKIIVDYTDDSMSFNDTIEQLLFKMDFESAGGCYNRIYQHVPLALAKMSQRGIPIHIPTLNNVELDRQNKLQPLVDDLIRLIPAMETCREKLEDQKPGVNAALKEVLRAYASGHGFTLSENEKGELIIESKNVKLNGASKLEGWVAWDKLQACKKTIGSCNSFRGVSREDLDNPEFRRLVPTMSTITVTLRIKSGQPNVQNLQRAERGLADELQFRSIVRAPEGYSLVINDYSQVELRLAAALSIRALNQAKDIIDGVNKEAPPWVRQALVRGANFQIPLNIEADGFAGFSNKFSQSYRTVLQKGTLMADAFRCGIDPHLLTGLNMAITQGNFDIGGIAPMDYLKSLSKAESKELTKTKLKSQRNSAKAPNFGLLYGMQTKGLWGAGITNYGLDWTMEEAEAAREAWFKLYPEIAFWQDFTRVACVQKASDAVDRHVRNKYKKVLETRPVRVGFSHTLSGRPVVAELSREVTNYSDQGSSADMMLESIVTLDERFRDCVMNTIHDEIILLVRDEDAEDACFALKKAMIDAEDRVLSPYGIPSEADPDVVKFWRKVD
jgi:DNA polymerase-1